jgi:DNA (cytosine-5)-methyltransferase 1
MSSESLTFIDLFCGIGGFHQALKSMGHKCVFASDIDKKCREIYEKNYGIKVYGDIKEINERDIPKCDVICGGFPCQPFSKAGFQEGLSDESRGTLFYDIMRIAKHHKPKYMLLENVRNLASHDNGNTWRVIRDKIRENGYNTYDNPIIANVLHFNVPQSRERVLIMCVRCDLSLPVCPILPKNPKRLLRNSVDKIIELGDCAPLSDKYMSTRRVWNKFLGILNDNNIEVPKYPIWTEWWDKNLSNLDCEKSATPKMNEVEFYNKYKECINKNQSFYMKNEGVLREWLRVSRLDEVDWKGAVRKMEWQAGELNGSNLDNMLWTLRGSGVRVKKADYTPTLVAMSMIPVYGPLNRKLTARELLRLQSFPDTFEYDEKHVYKQVGNSVNVEMIKWAMEYITNRTKRFCPVG